MSENSNNKYLLIYLLTLILFSCSISRKGSTNRNCKKIIDSFLENSKATTNYSKDYFLFVQLLNTDESFFKDSKYVLSITLYDKYKTFGLKYDKIYLYKNYQIVLIDSVNRNRLSKYFKPIRYEELNLSNKAILYNPYKWEVFFNNRNEVKMVLPQNDTLKIRNSLEMLGVRFSNDFNEDLR